MNDWHPIGTAPTDGTVVDLWMMSPMQRVVFRCSWADGEWTDPKGDCRFFRESRGYVEFSHWRLTELPRKKQALHFVGFRSDEYRAAVKVWGMPDFFHRGWDLRAQREIGPDDVVIFARGTAADEPRRASYNDLEEPAP